MRLPILSFLLICFTLSAVCAYENLPGLPPEIAGRECDGAPYAVELPSVLVYCRSSVPVTIPVFVYDFDQFDNGDGTYTSDYSIVNAVVDAPEDTVINDVARSGVPCNLVTDRVFAPGDTIEGVGFLNIILPIDVGGVYQIKITANSPDGDGYNTFGVADPTTVVAYIIVHVVGDHCIAPNTGDWSGPRNSCGDSCSSFGGISVELRTGQPSVSVMPAPGGSPIYQPEGSLSNSDNRGILYWKICDGGKAYFVDMCGNCFVFDDYGTGVWVLESLGWSFGMDNRWYGPRLSAEGGNITIDMPGGGKYTYDTSGSTAGVFHAKSVSDASGRVTKYDLDPSTGKVLSATSPTGRVMAFGHVDEHYGATDVSIPSGGSSPTYAVIAYGNSNYEKPTSVTIQDPAYPTDPQRKSTTNYSYYSSGKIKSIAKQSEVTSEVAYNAAGKVQWMWTHDGSTLYSQTEYTYGTEALNLDNDTGSYAYTKIHEYNVAPGTTLTRTDGIIDPYRYDPEYPEVVDPSDHISKHYYYTAGFVRSVVNKLGDGTVIGQAVYDVDVVETSKLYGRVLDIKEIDPASTTAYEKYTHLTYYEPDKTYDIPLNTTQVDDQSYVADSGSVPYAQVNDSDVYGNGLVRVSTTYTYDTSTNPATLIDTQETTYRYHIKNISGTLVMTPYVSITRDALGKVHKSILNDDGTVKEVYEDITPESGTLSLRLAKVYSYDRAASNDVISWEQVSETTKDATGPGRDIQRITNTYYDLTYQDNGDGGYTTEVLAKTWVNGQETSSEVRSKTHYNQLGHMVWSRDSKGRQTDYTYDYQGRNIETKYPAVVYDGETELTRKKASSQFDCCHLLYSSDAEENCVGYGYDGMNRVSKTWTKAQDSTCSAVPSVPLISYDYTGPFGAVKTTTIHNDSTTSKNYRYDYDIKGRITRIEHTTDVAGDLYDEYLQYDDKGRAVALLHGYQSGGTITAGKVSAFDYDAFGRVLHKKYDYSSSAWPVQAISITNETADVTYSYVDNTGRKETVTQWINGEKMVSRYEYDEHGRLEHYTPNTELSGPLANFGTITYTYNNIGQKTSVTVPLGINNKGKKIVYSYDAAGKPTGTHTVPVDVSSSVISEDPATESLLRFYYDDEQNRVKMITKSNDIYYFVYDPTASIPAVLAEICVTDTNREKQYLNIRTPKGSLISRETYDNQGQRIAHKTYHFDGLGSVVALSNESGVITDTYSYDEWGNVTHTDPNTGDQYDITMDNPYQHVGKYGYYTHYQGYNTQNPEQSFKLLQLGVRYYDPATGRFTQRDPIGYEGGLSPYAYADGNPLLAVDPTGLMSVVGCAANPAACTIAIGVIGGGTIISLPVGPGVITGISNPAVTIGAITAGICALPIMYFGDSMASEREREQEWQRERRDPGNYCDDVERLYFKGLPGFRSPKEAMADLLTWEYPGIDGSLTPAGPCTDGTYPGDLHYNFLGPSGVKGLVTTVLCKPCKERATNAPSWRCYWLPEHGPGGRARYQGPYSPHDPFDF